MNDQEQTEQPQDGQLSAQERYEAAFADFMALNRTLPPGMPPFQLPPFLETAASVDALARLLIDTGTLTEEQYVDCKAARMAEMIEALTEGARELKRQVTGLIIAGPRPQI